MPQRIFNINKIVENVNSLFSADLPQTTTQIKPRLSKCLRGVYIFAFLCHRVLLVLFKWPLFLHDRWVPKRSPEEKFSRCRRVY